jgi:hypothetical protein
VPAGIRAADGGDCVATADNKLVVDTVVVHSLRLGQNQGGKVKPTITKNRSKNPEYSIFIILSI